MNGRLLARSGLLQHCRFVFVDDEVPGLGLPGTPALAGGWGDGAVVTRVSGRWMGVVGPQNQTRKRGLAAGWARVVMEGVLAACRRPRNGTVLVTGRAISPAANSVLEPKPDSKRYSSNFVG